MTDGCLTATWSCHCGNWSEPAPLRQLTFRLSDPRRAAAIRFCGRRDDHVPQPRFPAFLDGDD